MLIVVAKYLDKGSVIDSYHKCGNISSIPLFVYYWSSGSVRYWFEENFDISCRVNDIRERLYGGLADMLVFWMS